MKRFYRINQYILSPSVRVVDEKGSQVGVMPTQEAIFKARQKGLDLVEVAPEAKPPVVKIIDFKKFKYQEDKKFREGKKKGIKQNTKEVRFTPFIAKNDFEVRIKKVIDFLGEGNNVKLSVKFVGRQFTRKEYGYKLLNEALDKLKGYGRTQDEPKWQGRLLTTTLSPFKKK
ncbi:translation initiation factor IF-3 [Candidatus Beckwithbacteria bacterium RBG_13_35_6]|uniref:Translation initiation factor IF-3 n=1 Tax=Candidatus Beckwithbacteria bacterium RBG_13_35_6 TaxID=1797456 RepID=A0A1F5DH71_9BACT|nr:MAG: translation initiation factor IF-3 [Candidatus Beckwithbacteria bacterium RBG_13_35_6]